MELDHHSFHPTHKLTYSKVVKRANKGVVCEACLDEISSQHYSCEECNSFLHKWCAKRPLEFTHSSHPLCRLRLLPKSPYDGRNATCNGCKKTIEGYVYHCAKCEFDLHIFCSFPNYSRLNHVFHPEHVLNYEKVVKKADRGVVCAACHEEISGRWQEHYCCRPCNFFLHKLCAKRPLELSHALHPLHPLQLLPKDPYESANGVCDACDEKLEGFVYHCEFCGFDIDFVCAFHDGLKVQHICHPDHKLTREKLTRKANNNGMMVCAACVEEISGRSTEYYSCRPCNFFLHKSCAKQPTELSHSLHPEHPLELLAESPYEKEDVKCDACNKPLEGFVYSCDPCDFDLDFTCAFPDGSKMNHICHSDHKLTRENVVKKGDRGVVCAACLEEIEGPLADYYSCRPCNFFLHKLCSQRPLRLNGPHGQALRLRPKDPSKVEERICRSCQKVVKGFVYDRVDYNTFPLDLKCAFPKPEKRIQNFEQLHSHPLTFHPRPAKFSCDLCSSAGEDMDDEDQSYSCSTCDFWVHKTCAYTALTQRYQDHQHPLTLMQGVPEDLQKYFGIDCDVCHNLIYPKDWVSHCARCRFFVHIMCMITEDATLTSSIKDVVYYLDDSFFKNLFMDDEFVVARWPPKDIASELFQPFLLRKNGITMTFKQTIRHFSHKQHVMILFQELSVNTDSFFEEEDEEVLCDACIHPITAPYYCCQECNYFLHSACANLPAHIKHFSHPHKLGLSSQKKFYIGCVCDRCQCPCTGFLYICKACKFVLDLTCAALPAVIMHETHDHPLFQMEAEDVGLCYTCCAPVANGSLVFKCVTCDVCMYYNCAVQRRGIRHRWDRQHPILLRFPPHGDHPDHFMCDMCEELINPKHWLYSCFQCDISFHSQCAKVHNVKFGGELQISSHPHILKFLRKATLKITCDKCESRLGTNAVFECYTCYYCICLDCGIDDELPTDNDAELDVVTSPCNIS